MATHKPWCSPSRNRSALAGTAFDQIKGRVGDRGVALEDPPHLGELLRQQLAEHGSHIDAGKKIARAPCATGGAGVIPELWMVKREFHVLGEADGTACSNAFRNQLAERIHTYCLRIYTTCSWS